MGSQWEKKSSTSEFFQFFLSSTTFGCVPLDVAPINGCIKRREETLRSFATFNSAHFC